MMDEEKVDKAEEAKRIESRTRSKKKQLMYRRHMARTATSPKASDAASPARESSIEKSSPSSPSASNPTSPSHVPRRQHTSPAVDRKMKKIDKIKKHKASVLAKSPSKQEENGTPVEFDSEEKRSTEPEGPQKPAVNHRKDEHYPDDEGPSLSKELDGEDEDYPDDEGPKGKEVDESSDPQEPPGENTEGVLQEDVLRKLEGDKYYEDPPIDDLQSEVSVATSGFDMRSIHDNPPEPRGAHETDAQWDTSKVVFDNDKKQQEEGNKDGLDIFETASWARTNTDFSAMPSAYPDIDEFAKQLLAGQERERRQVSGSATEEEEKKEKEISEVAESGDQDADTSWDTTNPVFPGRLSNRKDENATDNILDMFDTSSWTGEIEAAFSDVSLSRLGQHPDIETQFLRLMHEDLAKRALTDEQMRVVEEVRRNLKISQGSDSNANCDETTEIEKPIEPNDDEPLLIGISSSADEDEASTNKEGIPVEQRVEMYTTPNEKDDESSVADIEIPDDDNESDDEGQVEYVDQVSDDEGGQFIEESKDTIADLQPGSVSATDVPTFDVAARAASKSGSRPKVELEGINLVDETPPSEFIKRSNEIESVNESVASSLAGENFLGSTSVASAVTSGTTSVPSGKSNSVPSRPPIPPSKNELPPPPPPTEKKPNKNKSGEKQSVPLIPPPPEEKLKKWEEGKLRAQKHIESLKAKQMGYLNGGERGLDIEGPPEVTRMSFGQVEPSLFSTPEKKPKDARDLHRSPSGGEIILSDEKMAEKVALASSAAAVTFEEVVARSPDRDQETSAPELGLSSNPSARSPQGEMGMGLVGGAFSSWKSSDFEWKESPLKHADHQELHAVETRELSEEESRVELMSWFCKDVLAVDFSVCSEQDMTVVARLLLEDDTNFNAMCQHLADIVNKVTSELGMASVDDLTVTSFDDLTAKSGDDASVGGKADLYLDKRRPWLKPMELSETSRKLAPTVIAANFVSFVYLASKLAKVPSPFGHQNPFLQNILALSLKGHSIEKEKDVTCPKQLIFDSKKAYDVVAFVFLVTKASEARIERERDETPVRKTVENSLMQADSISEQATPCVGNKSKKVSRRSIVPEGHPSPFESSVWSAPSILAPILSFLGDPVVVCRVKMVNRFCCRIISENEHIFMQDAVRTGGLSMYVRPAFWMWITLQKCKNGTTGSETMETESPDEELRERERRGREGKWHSVIQRDVARSFGVLPPHKTGARIRNDSIVRALVTWGKNRIMKRGVKGGGDPLPIPEIGPKESRKQRDKPRQLRFSSPPWECTGDSDESMAIEVHEAPTDTVSDWGGVSPVGSFTGSMSGGLPDADGIAKVRSGLSTDSGSILPAEELALSGNCLTNDMKEDLQNKLSFILHSLASTYEDVGYCQGMDYVVAHLLRILQDTVRWAAVQGTLPQAITTASTLPDLSQFHDDPKRLYEEIDKSLIVEEAVFKMMDTFFTTYNLRHMYWPELRCLKTCCRVFEKLIQRKLPVLADHFEHHDLNVGLFALGWFQTLFLYLPSMPSATVCHMWDIWLVERSFKIFFRVGTAILFLSQPILLNHELEGMMTYLNTIPDATLLKPDILIACALNIKVTNSMLQEIEVEVTKEELTS